MKKIALAMSAVAIGCAGLYVSLQQNVPFIINTPPDMTLEKVLDPYSLNKDDSLYYLIQDKGYFDVDLENKLNTVSIFPFYSTGAKNMTTLTRKQLLEDISPQSISLYYRRRDWWNIDNGDSCAALLKGIQGQNYIIWMPARVCLPVK